MQWRPNVTKRCDVHGKLCYRNKEIARRAADKLDARKMNAYQCIFGQGWHIGHHEPLKARKPLKEIGVIECEE